MIIRLDYLEDLDDKFNGKPEVDESMFGGVNEAIDYVLENVLEMSDSACIYKIDGEYQVLPSGEITKAYEFKPIFPWSTYTIMAKLSIIPEDLGNRELLCLDFSLYYGDIDYNRELNAISKLTERLTGTDLGNIICVKLRKSLYEIGLCEYNCALDIHLSVESKGKTSTFTELVDDNSINDESKEFFKEVGVRSLKDIISSHIRNSFNCKSLVIDTSNVLFSVESKTSK